MEDELAEFKLSPKAKAKLKNKELIKKELAEGKLAHEILGFSERAMHKFYKAASLLLEHRRLEDAANAFLFLVTLNPLHHDYWMGLGVASQLSQNYEAAIDAYEMAAYCEVHNPTPYFYLAKCLFAMHDREAALEAINLALEYSEDDERFSDLHKQALAAKKLLENLK
jgi:type III secretion system low calcium response chaperone LcrH/SycD